MAGASNRTTPRNCTEKPFMSGRLGLSCETMEAAFLCQPEYPVIVDAATGGVKIAHGCNSDDMNSDADSISDLVDAANRFEAGEDFRSPTWKPLMQSVAVAKAWDARMQELRPAPPTGPNATNPAHRPSAETPLAIYHASPLTHYPGSGY